jgi:hypothetical protein
MLLRNSIIAGILLVMSSPQACAESGLVTKPSKYTVQETIDRFEAAIKSKAAAGWVIFNRIDHAAAAKGAGLENAAKNGDHLRQSEGWNAADDQERDARNRSSHESAGLAGRPGQGLADL